MNLHQKGTPPNENQPGVLLNPGSTLPKSLAFDSQARGEQPRPKRIAGIESFGFPVIHFVMKWAEKSTYFPQFPAVNPRLSWLKKKEPCGLALVDYEPNAARVGPAMDPGMRRRRARSLDAGDEGIMVAEPNGEVIPEEEVMEGEAESGGHGGAVPVNPFWSEKARAEAELQALRPKDLPRVPEGEMAEAHRGEPHGHDRDQEGWHKADTRSSSRSEFWSDVKRSLQEDLERENWPKGEAERGGGSGSDGHRGHPGGWPPEARHGDHPGGHRGWGREHGGEHPREYPGRGQAEHRVQGEGHHWGEYEGNPRGEYEGRPTERAEGGLAGAHGETGERGATSGRPGKWS